jgi:hypothetical protein
VFETWRVVCSCMSTMGSFQAPTFDTFKAMVANHLILLKILIRACINLWVVVKLRPLNLYCLFTENVTFFHSNTACTSYLCSRNKKVESSMVVSHTYLYRVNPNGWFDFKLIFLNDA